MNNTLLKWFIFKDGDLLFYRVDDKLLGKKDIKNESKTRIISYFTPN